MDRPASTIACRVCCRQQRNKMDDHENICKTTLRAGRCHACRRVQPANKLGNLILYARHFRQSYCSGDRLGRNGNLLWPDYRHADDGDALPVCRPATGPLWGPTGGGHGYANDFSGLPGNGLRPESAGLVRRLGSDRRRDASGALRRAVRRAGEYLWAKRQINYLARDAGRRPGFGSVLAARRRVVDADGLAACAADLCPVWPA